MKKIKRPFFSPPATMKDKREAMSDRSAEALTRRDVKPRCGHISAEGRKTAQRFAVPPQDNARRSRNPAARLYFAFYPQLVAITRHSIRHLIALTIWQTFLRDVA